MRETTEYASLEEYEFEMLEEIPKDNLKNPTIKTEDLLKLIKNFKKNCALKEFIGEHKGKKILKTIKTERFYERYEEKFNVKEGIEITDKIDKDKLLIIADKDLEYNDLFFQDEISELNLELETIMDNTRGELIRKYYGRNKYLNVGWDLGFFTTLSLISSSNSVEEVRQKFEKELKTETNRFIKTILEVRLDEEHREKKAEQEEINAKKLWEEKSIFKSNVKWNEVEINKNIILWEHNKFILEEDVNKLLPYGFWNNVNSSYGDLLNLCYYLNDKEITYELHKKLTDGTYKKNYKIEFGDEIKVDGVKIPKQRIIFVLKRADGTSNKVKMLKKLTARAIDLLNIKTIDLRYFENSWKRLNMPFRAETEDGQKFKISIIMKEFENVDYDILSKYLYGNFNYINTDIKKVCSLVEELGATKTELFEHLKRIKMLGDLNENN
jgi:hypothetical protein